MLALCIYANILCIFMQFHLIQIYADLMSMYVLMQIFYACCMLNLKRIYTDFMQIYVFNADYMQVLYKIK